MFKIMRNRNPRKLGFHRMYNGKRHGVVIFAGPLFIMAFWNSKTWVRPHST